MRKLIAFILAVCILFTVSVSSFATEMVAEVELTTELSFTPEDVRLWDEVHGEKLLSKLGNTPSQRTTDQNNIVFPGTLLEKTCSHSILLLRR